ncbi:hypothetical protein FQN49_000537 [Arthroderma sp. PD_2]|nr:hypothetical protein FQN49_000537 [Arthroderma sp. PD_2]
MVGFPVTEKHYPPVVDDEESEKWDEEWEAYGGPPSDFFPHAFRTEPIDDVVEPLLQAFGKALGAMPALESANLETWLSWDPSVEMQEEYDTLRTGVPYTLPREYGDNNHRWGVRYSKGLGSGRRLLEWQVGEWRASEETSQLFHRIGEGLEEVWKEFEYVDERDLDDRVP